MLFGPIKMCRSSIHKKSFKTLFFSPTSRLIEFPVNSNECWWWRGKAAIINHEHTALFFIWSVAARDGHRAEIQPGRRWQYVWLWFGREAIVPEHIHRHLNWARPLKLAFVWVKAALPANTKLSLYKFIWTSRVLDTVMAFFYESSFN